MDLQTHISAVQDEGARLAQAVTDLDAKVPTCPGWTLRDLVRHQGEVHRWARSHVAEARQTLNTADFRTFPPDDQGLLDWYRQGLTDLVTTLHTADPELDCYTFLPGPRGTRFWARRQAHETTIHRVDAQSASGEITPTSAEFAVDGIDEILHGFFARRPSRLRADPAYSFALRARDAGRDWLVRVASDGATTTDGPGEADATVTADAFDLYLLLWNRRGLDGLDVAGDAHVLRHWRANAQVHWS